MLQRIRLPLCSLAIEALKVVQTSQFGWWTVYTNRLRSESGSEHSNEPNPSPSWRWNLLLSITHRWDLSPVHVCISAPTCLNERWCGLIWNQLKNILKKFLLGYRINDLLIALLHRITWTNQINEAHNAASSGTTDTVTPNLALF